jgi:hypothetical protein
VSPDDVVFLGGIVAPSDDHAPAPSDLLKEKAASALERALVFVEANGDALTRRRAHVALQAEPVAGYVAMLAANQAEDGSFAPFDVTSAGWLGRELAHRGMTGRLGGTLQGLGLHADVRQDNAPNVEAAIRFIESKQAEDGSFGVEGTAPGVDGRLFTTALCAGSLGRSHYSRPEVLLAAGDWLTERWAPEQIEGGHFGELAAFSIYYSNVPDDDSDDALQWCGRELEKGFRSRKLEALALMQVLSACQVGSLPGASFAPEEILERLLEEQAADGGFDALSPDGLPARVAPTIDAMRSVIGLCATF